VQERSTLRTKNKATISLRKWRLFYLKMKLLRVFIDLASESLYQLNRLYELPAIDIQSLQDLFTHKVLKALLHKELIT
jgi:hypothetical protein